MQFKDPVMITGNQMLESVIHDLLQEDFITVDTEFVREHTYWPDLCLVQLAGNNGVFIVDAQAEGLDLSLLTKLLDDESVTKVFHAAQQDLEIFFHLFGRLPKAIFDTQIAAMVAGFGNQIGYNHLVESLIGVSIDKSHRFSDWSIRPLIKAQLNYAAADVTYLRKIYEILLKKLKEENRLSWVSTEIQSLSNPENYKPSIDKLWKRIKPPTHNRYVLGVLYEIIKWREGEAQRLNIPRQHLIRDESLLEIAAVVPTNIHALNRIRGVSNGFAEGAEGASLLDILKMLKKRSADSFNFPSLREKKAERPSEALLSLLKVLLLAKCEAYEVAPKLVASSKEIESLASGETELPVLTGWRRKVFGQDALDLCAGKLILGVGNRKIQLINRDRI
ncbi:MAG: ribonuclease D [Commensalibacter sp.]|nr:ribonuclease D [Commensalibacter sp.]